MKILVVGVFNDHSTNNGIANGFENAGHEVMRYDYRKALEELSPAARDYDIWSMSLDCELVFFCKCNGVHVDVVRDCKSHAKTFLWYMDPLNGNYNDELKEKIKVADYVGVAKREVYLEAKKLNSNTHFLIEGFDPKWDYPIERDPIMMDVHSKKYDISFIGNQYGDRQDWLSLLVDNIAFPINKFNIEHAKVVGQSRININLTGGGGPSDRVYKVLAAKGFLISQTYPDVEKYGLIPGRDLVFANTPEDMVEKCNYYLARKKERDEIAEHGYQTVQKFSRDNLAKQIIEIVDGSVSGREPIRRSTQDQL